MTITIAGNKHFAPWKDPTNLIPINIGVNKLEVKKKSKTKSSDITLHAKPEEYFSSIQIPKEFYGINNNSRCNSWPKNGTYRHGSQLEHTKFAIFSRSKVQKSVPFSILFGTGRINSLIN